MLCSDDGGIVSRSSEGLKRVMPVIVTASSAFGFTVSQSKAETMCLRTKGGGRVSLTTNAAGQEKIQIIELVYLDGAISGDREPNIETTRHFQRVWVCLQITEIEMYDRPGVRLKLKVWLLKAGFMETLLDGCIIWSLNKPDYDKLRRVHHSMGFRCLGWRKRKRDDHTLSYDDAFAKTDSNRIQAIVRKRRVFVARLVARMGEERLL